MATIRQDVVEISFKTDPSELDKLADSMGKLKNSASNGAGSAIDKLTQSCGKLKSATSGLENSLKGAFSGSGINKLKDDLEASKAAVSTTKSKIDSLKNSVARIKANPVKELEKAITGLQAGVGRSVTKFKQLARVKVDGIKNSLNSVKTALAGGEKGAKGLINALKNIGKISISKLVSGLKEMANLDFGKLASGLGKVASGLGSAVAKTAKVAAGALTAGTAAVGGLMAKGVSYNSEMEQYQTSFEVMTGSAQEAQKTVAELQKMGAATPFEMTELAETTKLLMNYGFTADDAMNRMSMLGDISQGSADKMNRIATAYGQMSSAGKVQLEDVKQMIEAGFNPLQEISQTTGESMESLYDRISKGTISVDEITASMQRSTSAGGKYFQSMQKQSQTFSGQMSTMKDNANQLLGGLTKNLQQQLTGEFLPGINAALSGLTDAFNQGGIDGFLTALPNALNGALDSVLSLVQTKLPTIMNVVVTALSSVVSSLASALPNILPTITSALMQLIQSLLDILQANGPQIVLALTEALAQAAQGLLSMLPQILDIGIKLIASLAQGIAQAAPTLIPAIVDAIIGMVDALISNIDLIIEAGLQLIEGLTQGLIQAIPRLIAAIPRIVTELASGIIRNLPMIIEAGIQLIVALTTGIAQAIPQLIAMIPEIFSGLWDAITSINWLDLGKSIITGIWDGIKGAASGLWKGIKGLFSDDGSAQEEGTKTGQNYNAGLKSSLNSEATGLQCSTNFASGLSSGAGAVSSAAQGLSNQTQTALQTATAGTSEAANEVATQIATQFTAITDKIAELPAKISELFTPIDQVTTKLTELPVKFATAFSALPNSVGNIEQAVNALRTALEPLPEVFAPIMPALERFAAMLVPLAQRFAASANSVKVLSNAFEVIANSLSNIVNNMNTFNTALAQVPVNMNGAAVSADEFINKFNEVPPAMQAAMKTTVTAIQNAMQQMVTAITTGGTQMVAAMQGALSQLVSAVSSVDLYSSGVNMMAGLVLGIQSQGSAAVSAAVSIANQINSAFDSIQKIASPSKVWKKKGRFLIKGEIQGMEDEIPALRATTQKVADVSSPYSVSNYTPERDGYYSNSVSREEYASYSPTFNVTVNGSLTDRNTVRQTKQQIFEMMNEYFANLARQNKTIRQV